MHTESFSTIMHHQIVCVGYVASNMNDDASSDTPRSALKVQEWQYFCSLPARGKILQGYGGTGPSAMLPLLGRWGGIEFVLVPPIWSNGARDVIPQGPATGC